MQYATTFDPYIFMVIAIPTPPFFPPQQLQADRNVVISNTESLLPKLQRLYQGGLGKLHVVTDFGT